MEDQSHTQPIFVESNKPQEQAPREDEVSHLQAPLGQKRLILSATSKSGVGKTHLSINLAEWLESLQVPFVAFASIYMRYFFEPRTGLFRSDLGFSYR